MTMAVEFETEFALLNSEVRLELLRQVRRLKELERERARLAPLGGNSPAQVRELCIATVIGEWRAALAYDEARELILLLACEAAEQCGQGFEWILAEKAERRLRRYNARVLPFARAASG